MVKKMNLLFPPNNAKIDRLLSRSGRAICGIMEREVVVPIKKMQATKTLLKAKGFDIIGMSEPIGKNIKIWFIPEGGF